MHTGFLTLLLALLAAVAVGKAPLKAVIVSYPKDTPDSVYIQAKDAIIAAVCNPQPITWSSHTDFLTIGRLYYPRVQ